jgi:hypothetical protein
LDGKVTIAIAKPVGWLPITNGYKSVISNLDELVRNVFNDYFLFFDNNRHGVSIRRVSLRHTELIRKKEMGQVEQINTLMERAKQQIKQLNAFL